MKLAVFFCDRFPLAYCETRKADRLAPGTLPAVGPFILQFVAASPSRLDAYRLNELPASGGEAI